MDRGPAAGPHAGRRGPVDGRGPELTEVTGGTQLLADRQHEILPLAFGAGGRVEGVSPGAGIATVTGFGYVGFLIGPPVIGFTAQALTLRTALGIVVLFSLASAMLAGWVKEETPGRRPRPPFFEKAAKTGRPHSL